jgi:hypothetical protein
VHGPISVFCGRFYIPDMVEEFAAKLKALGVWLSGIVKNVDGG